MECQSCVEMEHLVCFVVHEGLKFLIRLCTDLGLAKEAQDYAVKLKKVEKVLSMLHNVLLCCLPSHCHMCARAPQCLHLPNVA